MVNIKIPQSGVGKNICKSEEFSLAKNSGFSEFELVRQAMVYKALDYILKPINEIQLNKTIQKAIDEIEKEKAMKNNEIALNSLLSKSLPAFKENSKG